MNYNDRNAECMDNSDPPKYPNLFPQSLSGRRVGQPIGRSKVSEQLDYEGELVRVIGKSSRHIPRDQDWSHIFGMTLCSEGCAGLAAPGKSEVKNKFREALLKAGLSE